MGIETKLRELLERATTLEAKATAVVEGSVVPPGADLVDEVPPLAGADPDAEALVDELDSRLADLEEVVDAWEGATPPGEDPVADFEAAPAGEDDDEVGVDFDDFDDDGVVAGEVLEDEDGADGEKAWGACPSCGSKDRWENADGTARCESCGTELAQETKSDEEWAAEFLAGAETKADDGDPAEEMAELLQRRAQLS